MSTRCRKILSEVHTTYLAWITVVIKIHRFLFVIFIWFFNHKVLKKLFDILEKEDIIFFVLYHLQFLNMLHYRDFEDDILLTWQNKETSPKSAKIGNLNFRIRSLAHLSLGYATFKVSRWVTYLRYFHIWYQTIFGPCLAIPVTGVFF